jgi:hypothetical protein
VLLLADESAIHAAADAVAKVCENAGEMRRVKVEVHNRPSRVVVPAAKG